MMLKAGDIRKDGDQQRIRELGPVRGCFNNNAWDEPATTMRGPGKWEETYLVGHPILASDLMHLEFRREGK